MLLLRNVTMHLHTRSFGIFKKLWLNVILPFLITLIQKTKGLLWWLMIWMIIVQLLKSTPFLVSDQPNAKYMYCLFSVQISEMSIRNLALGYFASKLRNFSKLGVLLGALLLAIEVGLWISNRRPDYSFLGINCNILSLPANAFPWERMEISFNNIIAESKNYVMGNWVFGFLTWWTLWVQISNVSNLVKIHSSQKYSNYSKEPTLCEPLVMKTPLIIEQFRVKMTLRHLFEFSSSRQFSKMLHKFLQFKDE